MPIIESALGVEMAFEIAKSSKNVVALAIGLEDLPNFKGNVTGKEIFSALLPKDFNYICYSRNYIHK